MAQELKDKDRRFKNLELKVGVMAALAVFAIIFLIAAIGVQKDIFTKKFHLYFVSESGAGFTEGMPVKLSGFKIGRVKDIELTDGARVKVAAEINKKYDRWVRDGSKARLSKEGFIGESFIEITTGKPEGKLLADGDMIPFEKAGGVEELVAEAKPILTEVKEIITYINSPEGDIKQTLGNIKELTSELKETRSTLDAAIRDTGDAAKKAGGLIDNINKKTGPVMDSAESAMKNIDSFTGRLEPLMIRIEKIAGSAEAAAERLPSTMEKLDATVQNVKELTSTLADEGPRIREILANSETASRDGQKIVKGVKESWPVRLMVPPVKEPVLIPLDGSIIERSPDGRR